MLIGKEEVFMNILWDLEKPLSSMDIIEIAPSGTWGAKSDKNIHRIIRQLLQKDMVEVCGQVQSGTQYARLFRPTISREDYAIKLLSGFQCNSLVKIALGLTRAAKGKLQDQSGVDEGVMEEFEKMIREFRESGCESA